MTWSCWIPFPGWDGAPIAKSVALEIWHESVNFTPIPMQIDSEGHWSQELNLDTGRYHYCFLINNCFRVNDPETFPSYLSSNGRLMSSLVVEDTDVYKLTSDSSFIDVGHIEMYPGDTQNLKPERQFSNVGGEIGVTVIFNKVKGAHLVTFLWVNPNLEIAYSSECTVWDDPQCQEEFIQAAGWIKAEPENPLMPGKWHALVLLNGGEICCMPFHIRGLIYQLQQGKLVLK
ncbi:MAG: hypothetical protein AB1538_06160 [Bacillota bacterium]